MKKFLFLLLFLPSCKKDYCWHCNLNIASLNGMRGKVGSYWTYSTSQVEYCDKTQEEINKIMAENSHQGNLSRSSMDCSKAR